MGASAYVTEAPVLSLEMSSKSSINLTKKTCSNNECRKYFQELKGKFCQECSAPLENKLAPVAINLDESIYDTAMIILGEIPHCGLLAFSWGINGENVFIHFRDYEIECSTVGGSISGDIWEDCILTPATPEIIKEKITKFTEKHSKTIEKLAEITPKATISIGNKIFVNT